MCSCDEEEIQVITFVWCVQVYRFTLWRAFTLIIASERGTRAQANSLVKKIFRIVKLRLYTAFLKQGPFRSRFRQLKRSFPFTSNSTEKTRFSIINHAFVSRERDIGITKKHKDNFLHNCDMQTLYN